MSSYSRGRGRAYGRPLDGEHPPPRRPYERPSEAPGPSRQPEGTQSSSSRNLHQSFPTGSIRQNLSSSSNSNTQTPSQQHGRPSTSQSGSSAGASRPWAQSTGAPHLTKKGKEGVPHHHCVSNFFELLKKPNWRLFQYRIDFKPEITCENVRKWALRQHDNIIGRNVYHNQYLFTIELLAQPMELVVQPDDQSVIQLTVTFMGEVKHRDPMHTHVLNVVLRRCLSHLSLKKVFRSYYDPTKEKFLEKYNLRIWSGYAPSIRSLEDGLLLDVASVQKILRSDTAHVFLRRIHADWMASGQQEDPKLIVADQLNSQVVITYYNQRAYRIDGVDYDMKPTSTFYCRKTQRQVSYLDYYAGRYGVEITDHRQPLLFSRCHQRNMNNTGDIVFLVPELCIMTGLTEAMRNDIQLLKDVATITKESPSARVKSLVKFSEQISEHPEVRAQLNGWGLKFSREPVKCAARTLPPPNIIQGTSTYRAPSNGDWSKELTEKGRKMAAAPQLNAWFIVYPQNISSDVSAFMIELKYTAVRQLGWTLADPVRCAIDTDQSRNYVDCIRNEMSRRDYQLVVIVLRHHNTDIYRKVKTLTCCELPIPSQVLTSQLFRGGAAKRKAMTVKVAVQIAAKIGAEPWRVDLGGTPQNIMVCGYDAHRDKHQRRAVGAFVASINGTCSRYTSSVELHGTNEQISPNLHVHVVKALKAYMEENQGQLPEKIFLYREAANGPEMMKTKNAEIEAIRSACRNVGTNRIYTPGIAYVLINRNISTRFFAMAGSGPEHPPIGLIVDDTVTLPERFDYFLISRIIKEGTSSPTLYHVIFDTSQTTADDHQRLSYALTHLYYNWTGTMSIPAPVQYARKLARLVGECGFTARPDERLAKLPYYL